MPEVERKARGLDVHLPGRHEHGFKPDSLFANVALGPLLRALAHIAYGRKVLRCEAVFIAIDNDTMRVNLEGQKGFDASCLSFSVIVVVRVLEKLKDKTRVACVEILRKTVAEGN
jgi:hypothetical protein